MASHESRPFRREVDPFLSVLSALFWPLLLFPAAVLLGLYAYVARFAPDIADQYLKGVFACCSIAGFVWGVRRIGTRHPALDAGYEAWLAQTPWQPRLPLPRGPVRLIWFDALIAFLLVGLAYLLRPRLESSPLVDFLAPAWWMLIGAAGCLVFANWGYGLRRNDYVALAFPAVVGLVTSAEIALPIIAIGSYALAIFNQRVALKAFPWDRSPTPAPSPALGWPYSPLMTEPVEFCLAPHKAGLLAVLVALLVTWVVGAFPSDEQSRPEDISGLTTLITMACAFLALFRLIAYGPAICGRLCWGHRRATGRWILPEHDVIFAVPLLVVLIGGGLSYALPTFSGMSLAGAAGLSVGAAVFVAFGVGPSVARLHYTGISALVDTTNRNEFIEVNA